MTCKDCLHYCVCSQTVSDDNWPDTTPLEIRYLFSPEGCENFKPAKDYKKIVYGHWKRASFGPFDVCSVCGCCVDEQQCKEYFCPKCGADMLGGNK